MDEYLLITILYILIALFFLGLSGYLIYEMFKEHRRQPQIEVVHTRPTAVVTAAPPAPEVNNN